MVSEDRVLVEMLKAGDENALEQLIMRWRPAAEAYARNCLHDLQAAEDAVQESFLQNMGCAVRPGFGPVFSGISLYDCKAYLH